MRRRQFITLLASAAVAWPLGVHGQQLGAPARRIAVLLRVAKDDPDAQRDLQAFRDGLQALGWSAGKTILIEYRYASADPAQMDIYAAELVGLPAEVILAGGSCCGRLAKGDADYSNRLCTSRGPAQPKVRRKPGASRRQCDWLYEFRVRYEREMARTA